ncbi:cupin domain-containing protein [Pseudoalteromonas sp. T1lg65]|uniref:cupin domain-containing protein n=1 Tax=Pseudoalteromonas sp. T1lg65 TaxID=2077101 RepID=UPI003F798466
MNETKSVILRHAGEGIHVISAGNLYRIIAKGSETAGRFSLMESILDPNQGAPLHIHSNEDEAFFVLEGEVSFYTDETCFTVQKEGFISFGPNQVRGFKNNTKSIARMLIFYSSAGIEQMTVLDGQEVQPGTQASMLQLDKNSECPALAEQYGVTQFQTALSQYQPRSGNE